MGDQSTTTNRSERARLQLLAAPQRSGRVRYVAPRRMPRRPGERREPLSVQLELPLLKAACERGLAPATAAELCLERALVRADLAELQQLGIYVRLVGVAAATTVSRSLPQSKALYLRLLLLARDGVEVADGVGADLDTGIDVPLRLFPRVLDVVEELAGCGHLELGEALTLEIAAVSQGRTMTEWAALAALRLSL
jgi:hypothetical protein